MLSNKTSTLFFINKIFSLANVYKASGSNTFSDNILANACFEPSTTASFLVDNTIYGLGGNVVNFNKDIPRMNEDKCAECCVNTLSSYNDAIPPYPNTNIIIAGSGQGEHQTQALVDLFTIYRSIDMNDRTNILFIGDIKQSKRIHSLIEYMAVYPRLKINMLPCRNSGPNMEMLYNIGINHMQVLDDILIYEDQLDVDKYDIIYTTELQKCENATYVIDNHFISRAKDKCIIMSSSPTNNSIVSVIDSDSRYKYFEQIQNSIYVRKALFYSTFTGLKVDEKKQTS